jgi:Uma2 family endonuclease
MSTLAIHRRVTAEEFLEIEFGSDRRFQLIDGFIYAMAGGTPAHARVQGNLLAFLRGRLRGSGCQAYGPDMALKTTSYSIRYPDVTVYCGDPGRAENERAKLLADPRVIFEVLSPSTRGNDQSQKLIEYKAVASIDTIVFVDPEAETIEVAQRQAGGIWPAELTRSEQSIDLPSLALQVPREEIFARD